jgi:hypothetical protein
MAPEVTKNNYLSFPKSLNRSCFLSTKNIGNLHIVDNEETKKCPYVQYHVYIADHATLNFLGWILCHKFCSIESIDRNRIQIFPLTHKDSMHNKCNLKSSWNEIVRGTFIRQFNCFRNRKFGFESRQGIMR